ncbi:E1 ubiquitin-activating protein uba2 [Rhizina undulata]
MKDSTPMKGRDKHTKKSLGSLHDRIKQSRVLMVGAGGIGCELLKNLVLTGFGEVHIVDLDTIDLSNLNRQFLFEMQHIKKSKAIVAKETAGKFNPKVKLEAHHANIKDPVFNVSWFQSFNLVFNALDNLDARRHVNKMCLAADVPLIESGTTGFNGQVQVIRKGNTECYDCTQKPVPKSFPVCTIRSTPSQPIHCIVWAKSYLFTEIFGTSEESPDMDPSENSENAQEIANLKREASELKSIREKMASPHFAAAVFSKVFSADIERLRSMEDMWKLRKPPNALSHEAVEEASKGIDKSVSKLDQKVWSLEENYIVFADSLRRLSERMRDLKDAMKEEDQPPVLSFDKDDEDTLDFVAASANLRSFVFGIEARSKFDIKQMAGNIIPAIATTNAITAGVCVLQAFKVLRDDLSSARMVFLSRHSERVFSAEKLSPPNPSCEICGVARATIKADINRATLGDLVNMLRDGLKYGEEMGVLTTQLLYDPDFDDNLEKTLAELGFVEETFVTVVDEEDEERVNLVLAVTNSTDFTDDETPLSTPQNVHIGKKPVKPLEPATPVNGRGVKRHLEVEEAAGSAKKRKIDERPFVVIEDRPERGNGNGNGCGGGGGKTVEEVVVVEDDGCITID